MGSAEIPTISIVLGFFLTYLALATATNEASQKKSSGSFVVTGNVFCDTCLEGTPSERSYVISGSSVAVECRLNRKGLTVSVKGETDENGEFKVELPSNIFQSADQLSKCSVKAVKSPDNACRIPSKSAPSSLTLQSKSNGVVTYNAGFLSYHHQTVPASCYKKDFVRMMRGRAVAESFDEAGQQTTIEPNFDLPPLPISLPPLPINLPPLPINLPPLPFPLPPLPFPLPPLPFHLPPLPPGIFPPFPWSPGPEGPPSGFPPNPEPSTPGFSPNPPSTPGLPPLPDTPPGPPSGFPPNPEPSTPGFSPNPPSTPGLPPLPDTPPGSPSGFQPNPEPSTPQPFNPPFGTTPPLPSDAPFGAPPPL